MVGFIGVLVIKNIMMIAVNANIRFTKADRVLDRGKIYFGIYTFFISELLSKMDSIDELVASE